MSIVLSIYSQKAFKEVILPILNNADYSVFLEKRYFDLQTDLVLQLEVLDEKWHIKTDKNYFIYKNKIIYSGEVLKNKDILTIENNYNEKISIIVKEADSIFHSFDKLSIKNLDKITIGKSIENDIVYDFLKTVSKEHTIIMRKNGGFYIVNKSLNGTYVNSVKIETETQLLFGDYINIMGLHLIYLGDVLAIDREGKDIQIKSNKLSSYIPDMDGTVLLKNNAVSTGKLLYHRAPRNYEKLDSGSIEIEDPPEKNTEKQPSLVMAIGPSATMALPMLLGCMMMIYASSVEGGTSSLYMYSGLVMSLVSALIGIMWAVVNLRLQKKEEKAKEELRFNSYSEYLVEKTEEIKTKYNQTLKLLEEMYPSTEKCLEYNGKEGVLWNRNKAHQDFLTHRIGLGNIPFQIPIEISKRRFSLYEDELMHKPEYIKENYKTLYQAPVTIDLTKHHLVGIIGGKEKIGAFQIAQIISTQVAANNCYTDVKLGYVYNGKATLEREEWEFAKWMPHTWSEDRKVRFLASNKEEASDVFYELTKIFRERTETDEIRRSEEEIPKPYYVIFVSDATMLEGELFSKYVFEKNNGFGLTTVFLVESYEQLPNSCEFIIQNDKQFKGIFDVYDRKDEKMEVAFDKCHRKKLLEFTKKIAGLRVFEMEKGGEIPSALTFLDMLGVKKPEDIPVKELWTKNRVYENIRGLIGQKAGGVSCYLDVHEKYHGPHGLVAGTTGSGKSETLQTYMLSLAVNYSPEDIGFFVIDYKGGGMANLFDGLPHMIGQISNLSGNQVKRAMISIKSENKRRQRVFNENGVNNINSYTRLYKNGETTIPVPHLFIIIDEFAELKREEPDFMKELISVAQVGRSLGVHLILATQKPSGTVDDNIWSNSKFRLCLRVQDKQDSMDMLHKPDAAYLTQAGRCYLQVGNDEIYELFQSGYSGAIFDKNVGDEKTDIARMLQLNGKIQMTGNMAKASRKKKAQYIWIESLIKILLETIENTGISLQECMNDIDKKQNLVVKMYSLMKKNKIEYGENSYNTQRLVDFIDLYYGLNCINKNDIPAAIIKEAQCKMKKLPEIKEKTQLEAVKEYLTQIAKEVGYNQQLQLWMPVLPEKIYLNSFNEFRRSSFLYNGWNEMELNPWSLSVIVGKLDDPENQNQMPLEIDFASDGHIAVCGNIVSGKSTMLQTMIYALIQKYTPDMINIYGIDFSSKMMAAFEKAPQVGGVMYENDIDKIAKFFNMMQKILHERKNLFKGGNYSQFIQVNGGICPAVIIFIDNYASFKEKTEEMFEDIMIQLSKEGVNYGIFLVVSGNGFGMNDITTRVGENINTVICLLLQDRYAYGDLLHTMQFDVLPEVGIKGRGLACYEGRILEYQTALALEAENDYQRLEKIKQECVHMNNVWKGKKARKIPEIPEKPTWSVFEEAEGFEKALNDRTLLPIGYDSSNADIYSIPLKYTYCYLIWGAKRTGKTNLMKVAIRSAMKKESKICIIDSPEKKLALFKKEKNIVYAYDEQSVFDFFKKLLPEFKARNVLKQEYLSKDYDEDEIYFEMSKKIPCFIFISDLSWVVPFIYNAEMDLRGFLENILEKGQLHNIFFISELSLEKREMITGYPIYELFAGYKTGIHLGGRVVDNMVLSFEYLSYTEQNKGEKVGIGQLPENEDGIDTRKIIIPLARR